MQIDSYLLFNGQCEEAFKFYEKCLGGKIEAMMTHEGTPMEQRTPAEWRGKIMHARMTVGNSVLMGSDMPPAAYEIPKGFCVNIGIEDPQEADRVFGELAENGQIKMPIQPTFWAQRFGQLVDRFGTCWMVNCE
jgi:PhnB protein